MLLEAAAAAGHIAANDQKLAEKHIDFTLQHGLSCCLRKMRCISDSRHCWNMPPTMCLPVRKSSRSRFDNGTLATKYTVVVVFTAHGSV